MKDGKFPDHEKVRRAGPKGYLLWDATACSCDNEGTDGFVDPFRLADSYARLAFQTPNVARKTAAVLVEVGLWHDAATVLDCEACTAVIVALPARKGRRDDGSIDDGWFYFHGWSEWQLEAAGRKDGLKKAADLRRKALTRGPGLTLRDSVIRKRDRDLCRYCGIPTLWGTQDRKSDDVGEIDHIDPLDHSSGPKRDGNSQENCVVACKACNVAKGQRTPEQWCEEDPVNGRPLLPEPDRYRPSKPSRDQARIKPESGTEHAVASRGARVGSGPDSGRVGSGPGPDRSGPAGPDVVHPGAVPAPGGGEWVDPDLVSNGNGRG